MAGNDENPCDVDDLLCQMGVLSHLKGMQGLLGDERFKTEFPEFEGLGDKLTEKIQSSEENIRDAFKRCGLPDLTQGEEPLPEIDLETEVE